MLSTKVCNVQLALKICTRAAFHQMRAQNPPMGNMGIASMLPSHEQNPHAKPIAKSFALRAAARIIRMHRDQRLISCTRINDVKVIPLQLRLLNPFDCKFSCLICSINALVSGSASSIVTLLSFRLPLLVGVLPVLNASGDTLFTAEPSSCGVWGRSCFVAEVGACTSSAVTPSCMGFSSAGDVSVLGRTPFVCSC